MDAVVAPELLRDAAINLRALPEQRDLIDHAATLLGKNRSDFMLEAACERAQAVVEMESERLRNTLLGAISKYASDSVVRETAEEAGIDIAVRDDLSAQAECSFRVLLKDQLYPAMHPGLARVAAEQRTTLHGEREMDWSHWAVQAGVDVGQQQHGLNFSDPGLLLDAACQGLGIALVSQLLSQQALANQLAYLLPFSIEEKTALLELRSPAQRLAQIQLLLEQLQGTLSA